MSSPSGEQAGSKNLMVLRFPSSIHSLYAHVYFTYNINPGAAFEWFGVFEGPDSIFWSYQNRRILGIPNLGDPTFSEGKKHILPPNVFRSFGKK